jgi:hypothetical protein
MSRRKEETIEALHQMLVAYESLPDDLAEKVYFDLSLHRAETLEELRTVTDALPELTYRPSNMAGDVDCLNASLSSAVRLHLFHRRVLGDHFVQQPADLSLLRKDAIECQKR